MNIKPLVYVAGPLTKGIVTSNIRRAILKGHELALMGYGVFIPHLNCLWEIAAGDQDYEFWLDQDMQVLAHCQAIYALDGESPGRDREVAFARERGIDVLTTLEEAKDWLANYEKKNRPSY